MFSFGGAILTAEATAFHRRAEASFYRRSQPGIAADSHANGINRCPASEITGLSLQAYHFERQMRCRENIFHRAE